MGDGGLHGEDAGVVDQRVDTTKARCCFFHDALGHRAIGNVACHGNHVGTTGRLDRTRVRDHAVIAVTKRLDEARADTL